MKHKIVNIPNAAAAHEALQERLAQVRNESERRLRQLASKGKSNLTFNDLTFLMIASQATLMILVREYKRLMAPENWSRVELARTTPSWTREQSGKALQEKIKGLRLAIRRAKATLENAL